VHFILVSRTNTSLLEEEGIMRCSCKDSNFLLECTRRPMYG
jgi:hypothetical protein